MKMANVLCPARSRWAWALVGVCLLAAGVLLRVTVSGPVAKYGGGALWTMLVYALVMFVCPSRRVLSAFCVTLLIAIAVECLQLTSIPMTLYRVHPLFGWVLGTMFHLPDFVAYGVGAVSAAGVGCCLRGGGLASGQG